MRNWLKEIRNNMELSQEAMAERLSLPKSTYCSYERNHRTPEVKNAKRIAKQLGIDWTLFYE